MTSVKKQEEHVANDRDEDRAAGSEVARDHRRKERVVCDPLDLHVNAVIERGLGSTVTDVDGNTMLDLSSGLGCLLVGHSHPKVVEAVKRQAATFSHTDVSVIPCEVNVELAERLVERVGPGRSRSPR